MSKKKSPEQKAAAAEAKRLAEVSKQDEAVKAEQGDQPDLGNAPPEGEQPESAAAEANELEGDGEGEPLPDLVESAPARVAVTSKVNMIAKDGTLMVVGKACTLSAAEHERLKNDKRHKETPFFKE